MNVHQEECPLVRIGSLFKTVFLFIVVCPGAALILVTLRKRVFVCHQPRLSQYSTVRITQSARSSCFIQNSPSATLFICLREQVCGAALLYDPAHFPLTFHFLYSHPVSVTTALCESVCCLHFQCVLTVQGLGSYSLAPLCLFPSVDYCN